MTLFAAPGPRWFSIPAHRPFVDDLARGLLDALGSDPEALADAVIAGGPVPGATIEDGVASVRAMIAIAQSAASGKPVRLADVAGWLGKHGAEAECLGTASTGGRSEAAERHR